MRSEIGRRRLALFALLMLIATLLSYTGILDQSMGLIAVVAFWMGFVALAAVDSLTSRLEFTSRLDGMRTRRS
jgi:hypothetical protein